MAMFQMSKLAHFQAILLLIALISLDAMSVQNGADYNDNRSLSTGYSKLPDAAAST